MPRLKISDNELPIDELEEAEYSEDEYEDYDGEDPPKGTILWGYIKKMWWTYTQNEDPMIKVLFIAAENPGDLAEYDGCPIWENAALTAAAKFKWAPLLRVLGLTIRDVKTKTVVASQDDESMNGAAPIEKIASWGGPGVDSDDAYLRVVIGRERYNGEWQTRIGKWLEWEEPGEEPEEPDEPDEPEPEPEPEKAPRGRRAPAKAPAKAEPKATPSRARRGQNGASRATAARPAARGRGRRSEGSDDEPPF